MKKIIRIIGVVSVCLITLTLTTAQTSTAEITRLTNVENSYPFWSPDGSQIVFQSNRTGGNSDIYTMRTDGIDIKRLTNSLGDDYSPVWSPNGQEIVFQSSRDGNEELYLMNIDGTNQQNITLSQDAEMHPKWHPDGHSIIFSAQKGYWKVVDHWQINRDGSQLERITRNTTIDTYVSWSPSADRILGRKITGTNSEIFLFDAEGQNGRNLTNDPAYDGWPTWHPSGKAIVYASENDEGEGRIYELAVETLKKTLLISDLGSWTKPIWNQLGTKLICTRTLDGNVDIFTYDSATKEKRKISQTLNESPSLSPDGNQIVFHSRRFGTNDIFKMSIDGSNLTRLTNSPGNDRTPSWSPDGAHISFVSTRGGNYDVFVMNADGSQQQNLTRAADSKEVHPYWSSDGKKIILNSSRENETYGIYTIKADGSDLRRIEENGGGDNTHAQISPDGQKILFRKIIKDENWNSEIFIMDEDGKNEKRLTRTNDFCNSPAWSPNGAKVIFALTNEERENTHLYMMNADGSEIVQVTPEEKDVHYESPTFTHDGKSIICTIRKNGNQDVVLIQLK